MPRSARPRSSISTGISFARSQAPPAPASSSGLSSGETAGAAFDRRGGLECSSKSGATLWFPSIGPGRCCVAANRAADALTRRRISRWASDSRSPSPPAQAICGPSTSGAARGCCMTATLRRPLCHDGLPAQRCRAVCAIGAVAEAVARACVGCGHALDHAAAACVVIRSVPPAHPTCRCPPSDAPVFLLGRRSDPSGVHRLCMMLAFLAVFKADSRPFRAASPSAWRWRSRISRGRSCSGRSSPDARGSWQCGGIVAAGFAAYCVRAQVTPTA